MQLRNWVKFLPHLGFLGLDKMAIQEYNEITQFFVKE
jgi:hypothetical protein